MNNSNGMTLVKQAESARKEMEEAEQSAKKAKAEFTECLQLPNTVENRIIKALAFNIVGDKIEMLAIAQGTYRKASEALRIFKHHQKPALTGNGKVLRH